METVQIGSPENLLWPATEIHDLTELKPQLVQYSVINQNAVKYVPSLLNNLIYFKVR